MELSGLHSSERMMPSSQDSEAERYAKYRDCARRFAPLQLGLACFKCSPTSQGFEVDVFSIFLSPRRIGNRSALFSWSPSAFQFLIENGFDFSKTFSRGLSFLNKEAEEGVRAELMKGSYDQNDIHREEFDPIHQKLSSWADDPEADLLFEIELKTSEGLGRLLVIYELLRTCERMEISSDINDKIAMRKCKNNSEQRSEYLERIISEMKAGSELIQMLAEAEKPIVGHNLYLDLLHTYNAFYADLPAGYAEWKRGIRQLFPHIIDTKLLAMSLKKSLESEGLELFSLGRLYEHLPTKAPKIAAYTTTMMFHDAAFDAYATGVVFLRLSHRILHLHGLLKNKDCVGFEDYWSGVKAISNRIYFSLSASGFIDLSASDSQGKMSRTYQLLLSLSFATLVVLFAKRYMLKG